jgi:hypothetical protein
MTSARLVATFCTLAALASCSERRDSKLTPEAVKRVQSDIIAFGQEYAPEAHRALVLAENDVAERALLLSDYETKLRAAGEKPVGDQAYRARSQELELARDRVRQLTEARKRAYLAMQAAHLEPARESPDEHRAREAHMRAAMRELEQLTGKVRAPSRTGKIIGRKGELSASPVEGSSTRRAVNPSRSSAPSLELDAPPPNSAIVVNTRSVRDVHSPPPAPSPSALNVHHEREILSAPRPAHDVPLQRSPLLQPYDETHRPLLGVH